MTVTSLWHNLVVIFLQTVIKVIYWFLFPNFIEDCNRLLPDRAAESSRSKGLRANCTCRSTIPALELSANDWEWTKANYSYPCLNLLEILRLKRDIRSFCEGLIRSQNSFRIGSRTGEDMGQFSAGSMKLACAWVLETSWECTWSWWRTFWVFTLTQKVYTLSVFALYDFWERHNCLDVMINKGSVILSIL